MTTVLRVGDREIAVEEIIPLLAGYQLLPQLLRELIIDQAIAPFSSTPEEKANALRQFFEQHQLPDETAQKAWTSHHKMTWAQVEALATRGLLIEKYKQATWGHKIESYFLGRKSQNDIFELRLEMFLTWPSGSHRDHQEAIFVIPYAGVIKRSELTSSARP